MRRSVADVGDERRARLSQPPLAPQRKERRQRRAGDEQARVEHPDAHPEVITPAGPVTVEGTVVPAQRVYQLEHAGPEGRVWLSFSMDRLRRESRLDLQPLLLQQESELDDGLERTWQRPDSGRDKHLAYAFQWFAMAFAILVIYVVLGFRRSTTAHGQT